MKKSIYIFGPIHISGKNYLTLYKELNKLAENYFQKVIGTYPDFWNSKESPKRFYNRTYKTITKCNLFIAEVSTPSSGTGMELQMSVEHKIPVIALCLKESKPSSMVLGLPTLKNIIYYKNPDDLTTQLEPLLKKYSK